MSERLPRLTAAEVIQALQKVGFQLTRQSGSHKIFKNLKGKRVTVPFHAHKILHSKLLGSILKDAELSVEEFKTLLK